MKPSHRMSHLARPALAGLIVAALLGGCVVGPPPRPRPPPPPPPVLDTTVYAYPQQGQTPEQLDRDRYECYLWASKQTGFDPSAPNVPPHDRVVAVVGGPPPAPPGAQTAVGAITGGLIGALIAPPRAAGFGALAGAVVGGTIGASAEASQNQQAQYVASQNAAAQQAQMAQVEQKASDYRRALGACLEGRGYTIK
jgi:hypothetical protein